MLALLSFVLAVLTSPFKSKSRLEAENAALRHQLIILRRKVRGRLRPTNSAFVSSDWFGRRVDQVDRLLIAPRCHGSILGIERGTPKAAPLRKHHGSNRGESDETPMDQRGRQDGLSP